MRIEQVVCDLCMEPIAPPSRPLCPRFDSRETVDGVWRKVELYEEVCDKCCAEFDGGVAELLESLRPPGEGKAR